eukprot:3089996-Rhodomonas_salina.1
MIECEWNIKRLLAEQYHSPRALGDLGIRDSTLERVAQAPVASAWNLATSPGPSGDVPDLYPSELCIAQRPESITNVGPFFDTDKNQVWAAAALETAAILPRTDWGSLSDVDMLEPDRHSASRP